MRARKFEATVLFVSDSIMVDDSRWTLSWWVTAGGHYHGG